jgi:hypothetical protein
VREDKFCTIIFVIKFFLSLNSVICSLRIRILQTHSTVKRRVSALGRKQTFRCKLAFTGPECLLSGPNRTSLPPRI